MRLRDVAGVQIILDASAVSDDPIWSRQINEISEGEFTLFYARQSLAGRTEQAIEAIERAQAAAIIAAYNGQPAASSLIAHTPPQRHFMVDDIVAGLSALTLVRRRACLYALATKMTPTSVTAMVWSEAPGSKDWQGIPGLAREILMEQTRTRHIKLPYVFWEWATRTIAAPLLGLQATIETAFECTWPALLERYSRITQIDRAADAASFLELAEEVRSGRL